MTLFHGFVGSAKLAIAVNWKKFARQNINIAAKLVVNGTCIFFGYFHLQNIDEVRKRAAYCSRVLYVAFLFSPLVRFLPCHGYFALSLSFSRSSFCPEQYGTNAWAPFSRGRHKARDKLLRVFTLNRLSTLRLHGLEGIDSLVKARDNHLRVRAIGISQASTSRRTDIHVSIIHNGSAHWCIDPD